jgi:hypothetical protein
MPRVAGESTSSTAPNRRRPSPHDGGLIAVERDVLFTSVT